ncbi:protein kinase domain-containing protein [Herpetosiphon geysericola]|uniref:Protein kinase domain-containing protein n=2 Tax=Herpetosiphon geysericola TaxID=70996 RepID=A0A0P6XIK1_9CHLR|nr:protein kinase [Herpetosiphon geysericola]KPL79940.1 hypothetical protein SE18_25435 [Herpetosiphon geysericola]
MIEYQVGDIILGEYHVFQVLKGGQGIVYLCKVGLGTVALKTFNNTVAWDTNRRNMFRKEALVWLRLGFHPYIVPALGFLMVGEQPYILSEAIVDSDQRSFSLDTLLQERGQLNNNEAVVACWQIITAMIFVTRQMPDLVHCDLKPSNILVDSSGTMRISDFGLVQALSNPQAGSIPYMSPEQVRGTPLDARSDIFALGAITYELLTGRLAFPVVRPGQESSPQVISQALADLAKLHSTGYIPADIDWRVPSDLRAWIKRCLASNPEDRYRGWDEAQAALAYLARTRSIVLAQPPAYEVPPQLLLLKAFSFFTLGYGSDAWELCNALLDAHPHYKEGQYLKIVMLFEADGEEAQQVRNTYIDQLLATDPHDARFWMFKAMVTVPEDDSSYAYALECINRALTLDSQLADAWAGRAIIMASYHGTLNLASDTPPPPDDMIERIINDIQCAVALNQAIFDFNPVLMPIFIRCWRWRSSPDYALQLVSEGLSRYPMSTGLLLQRADILLDLERFEDAQEDLDRVFALDENSFQYADIQRRANQQRWPTRYGLSADNSTGWIAWWEQASQRERELDARTSAGYDPLTFGRNVDDYVWRAKYYESRKQLDQAIQEAHQALMLDPWNTNLLWLKSTLLATIDYNEEVITLLERARTLERSDFNIHRLYLIILIKHTRFAEAITECLSLSQEFPDNQAHLTRIQHLAYQQRGFSHNFGSQTGLDEALRDANSALRLDPRAGLAYELRGMVHIELGRYEAALEDFTQAIAYNEAPSNAYAYRSNLHLSLGDLQNAVADAELAIEANPESGYAYSIRADCAMLERRIVVAQADYDRAVQLESDLVPAYVGRASIALMQGNIEGALADCDTAIAQMTLFAPAYLVRAGVQIALGRLEEANADLDTFMELIPNPQPIFAVQLAYNRAVCYVQEQRYGEALQQINQGLQYIDRIIPIAQGTYSILLLSQRALLYGGVYQRPHEALRDTERALSIDSQIPDVLVLHATLLMQCDDFDGAFQAVIQALQIEPRHAPALALRGSIWTFVDELDKAHEDLTLALDLDDQIPQAHLGMGVLLTKRGELQTALIHLEQAAAAGLLPAHALIGEIKQAINPTMNEHSIDKLLEIAFEAFQVAKSFEEIQHIVAMCPLIADHQIMALLEEGIQQEIVTEERPLFLQRLQWLRQAIL